MSAYSSQFTRVHAADLDGDGDLDALEIPPSGPGIAWYENTDGRGGFGEKQIIATDALQSTARTADIDSDGDLDVLLKGTVWLENIDGQASSWRQHVMSSRAKHAGAIFATDLDGDGDVDVLAEMNDEIIWFENRRPGDANNDGAFSTSDLVMIFQGGKYEVDTGGQTTFEEGDWNDDGRFDSADLIFAFQSGYFGRARGATAGDLALLTDIALAVSDKRERP
jgi:hypothetical protein